MNIPELLQKEGPLKPREIARKLGRTPGGVRSRLCRLAKEGIVQRLPDGRYMLANVARGNTSSDDVDAELSWLLKEEEVPPSPSRQISDSGVVTYSKQRPDNDSGNTVRGNVRDDQEYCNQDRPSRAWTSEEKLPPVIRRAIEARTLEVLLPTREPNPVVSVLAEGLAMVGQQAGKAASENLRLLREIVTPEPRELSLIERVAVEFVARRLTSMLMEVLGFDV